MSYVLYYSPDSCNVIVRHTLEALNVSYDDRLINRKNREQETPEYLRLNPQGLIPVLVDDSFVLFETGAICLHLAEKHQSCFPSRDSIKRSEAYKWFFFITNNLHADLRVYWYAEKYGSHKAGVADIRQNVGERLKTSFDILEEHIQSSTSDKNPFLAGLPQPSILDFYASHMARGACLYPIHQPLFDGNWDDWPGICGWLEKLQQVRAIQKSFEREKIPAPYFLKPRYPGYDVDNLIG